MPAPFYARSWDTFRWMVRKRRAMKVFMVSKHVNSSLHGRIPPSWPCSWWGRFYDVDHLLFLSTDFVTPSSSWHHLWVIRPKCLSNNQQEGCQRWRCNLLGDAIMLALTCWINTRWCHKELPEATGSADEGTKPRRRLLCVTIVWYLSYQGQH